MGHGLCGTHQGSCDFLNLSNLTSASGSLIPDFLVPSLPLENGGSLRNDISPFGGFSHPGPKITTTLGGECPQRDVLFKFDFELFLKGGQLS